MPLNICSLNSGSNGNCYYVGSEQEAVLIDAGLSCRETERRMASLGLSIRMVKGIFITHEHTDHTRGVEVISRKYQIPVYITAGTHQQSRIPLSPEILRHFSSHEPISVGGLKVIGFPKRHDAIEPHSFTVSGEGVTIGVMTDIGSACEHVVHHFMQCHAAFLETNYDEHMLETGRYPIYLKRRIKGENGHLSNRQALQIVQSFKSPYLSHLVLSHLSQENNHPQLVHELFTKQTRGIHITVASRFEPTEVLSIR